MLVIIENGFTENGKKQMRVLGKETGKLVGLITEKSDHEWRVEMMMTYDVTQSNRDRALGFAWGIAAATPDP